jgi:hypothetical protein
MIFITRNRDESANMVCRARLSARSQHGDLPNMTKLCTLAIFEENEA